jgi:hypothetical protein
LPQIRERLAKVHEHETLLRASNAPNNNVELLRPSEGGGTEPPNELLRPKER